MEQKNVNQSKTKLNESNPTEIDPIEPKIRMRPRSVEDGVKTLTHSKTKLIESNPA